MIQLPLLPTAPGPGATAEDRASFYDQVAAYDLLLRTIALQQAEAAQATRERDFLLPFLRPGLLGSAITLRRLAMERGKPDAQRESGFQQRDEVLIEGGLKQLQRRYDPEVEKATLRYALKRYYALPASQRLNEFDAAFGANETIASAKLDSLYAQTKLGVEADRLALMKASPDAVLASTDPLMQLAAALQPALAGNERMLAQVEGWILGVG